LDRGGGGGGWRLARYSLAAAESPTIAIILANEGVSVIAISLVIGRTA
jgi:hypothetical protein